MSQQSRASASVHVCVRVCVRMCVCVRVCEGEGEVGWEMPLSVCVSVA